MCNIDMLLLVKGPTHGIICGTPTEQDNALLGKEAIKLEVFRYYVVMFDWCDRSRLWVLEEPITRQEEALFITFRYVQIESQETGSPTAAMRPC